MPARYHPRAYLSSPTSRSDAPPPPPPPEFQTLEQAREVSDGQLPIFAREFSANGPWRRFMVATFPEMVDWFARAHPTERRVHEYVNPNVVCKFAADLDADEGEGEINIDECVLELARRVQSALGLEKTPRALVTHSPRPGKLSRHVTFPDVVMDSWMSAGNLGKAIKREGGDLGRVLDEGVFTRRGGTLRTAFSTGYQKHSWLVPVPVSARDAQDRGESDAFDAEFWKNALVTYVAPPPSEGEGEGEAHAHTFGSEAEAEDDDEEEEERKRSKTSKREFPLESIIPRSDFTRVLDRMADYYMHEYSSAKSITACEHVVYDDAVTMRFHRLPCLKKRGQHPSNRVSVTWVFCSPPPPAAHGPEGWASPRVRKLSRIRFTCFCDDRPHWDEDLAEIKRAERYAWDFGATEADAGPAGAGAGAGAAASGGSSDSIAMISSSSSSPPSSSSSRTANLLGAEGGGGAVGGGAPPPPRPTDANIACTAMVSSENALAACSSGSLDA